MMNIFSSSKTVPASQEKKKSFFRWMNAVDTDALVVPLAQSMRAIAQLIAAVFVLYKLLPKDYAGLNDPHFRLSSFRVFTDAWKNVRFTREGAPSALLFFAVLGIVLTGFVSVFAFVATLFVGTAHAQGIFDCPPQDLGCNWIRFLFLPDEPNSVLPTYLGGAVAGSEWGLRNGLQYALGFYSGAILIIAGLLLFYYVVQMVVETAHKGRVMGNEARQMWVPLRLVIAIGLLVPLNGTLNSGQYIAIKTAQMGSALASGAWNIFLNHFDVPVNAANVVVPANLDSTALSMILNYACMYSTNARAEKTMLDDISAGFRAAAYGTGFGGAYDAAVGEGGPYNIADPAEGGGEPDVVEGMPGMRYSFSSNLEGNVCGSYFIPTAPTYASATAQAAFAAEQAAFNGMLDHFRFLGETIYQYMPVNEADGGEWSNFSAPFLPGPIYVEAIVRYRNAVKDAIQNAIDTTNFGEQYENAVADMRPYGWAMAGAFLATIERLQAEFYAELTSGLPSATPPGDPDNSSFMSTAVQDLEARAFAADGWASLRAKVLADLEKLAKTIQTTLVQVVSYGGVPTQHDLQCAGMIGVDSTYASEGGWIGKVTTAIANQIFALMDRIATYGGVWRVGFGPQCEHLNASTFQIGFDIQQGGEIFENLITFGHRIIGVGISDMTYGMLLVMGAAVTGLITLATGGLAGALVGALGAAAGFVGGLFFIIGTVFLAIGLPLTFILPMIPFIHFFFAVVVWIGEVFESVVAIPLVALAQLHPEGEGFAGRAATAYQFLFSIFVRPILTLFGLIAGALIFVIFANFLSLAYGVAVGATGATVPAFAFLSKFMFTMLYVYLIMICANKSFEMISHFPRGAMDWMGAKSSPTPNLHGMGDAMTKLEFVAGYAAKAGIADKFSKFGAGAGKAIGTPINKAMGGDGADVRGGGAAGQTNNEGVE